MTNAEIALFVLAGLIGLLGWYIETHSEEKPQYKRRRPPAARSRKAGP